MSPVFSARKRADEFNSMLERSSASGGSSRDADLLELVGALRSVAPVQPRAEFTASLREQLMAAAATELVPTTSTPRDQLTITPRRTARDRRLAAAVGGLAIVGATTSMAMAAQSALPGDVLYPLKRALEDAHTSVSFGDANKGSTLLANAAGRLHEVDALARENSDAAEIEATLDDFAAQAAQASDLLLADFATDGDQASIADLRDFAARSLAALDKIAALLPDSSRDALVAAGNVLAGIDAAATRACPSCAGDTISRFPVWLATTSADVRDGLDGAQNSSPASVTGHHKPSRPAKPGVSSEPVVDPDTTVLAPPASSSNSFPNSGGAPSSSNTTGPLSQLGDLLGGGPSAGSTANSSAEPDLGDVVGGVLDGVTGVILPSPTPSTKK